MIEDDETEGNNNKIKIVKDTDDICFVNNLKKVLHYLSLRNAKKSKRIDRILLLT